MVQKANVPPKVQFFAWPVALGIINTREKIQRRNPKTCLSPSWCVMCRKNEETSTHPFLHCDVASLYGRLCVAANILWAAPTSCKAVFMVNIFAFRKGRKARTLWKCVVLALFWVTWEERISRIFVGEKEDDVNGLWTGFNSFLLFGRQLPRIFKIPHSFSFSLIGMQFWVNFVGMVSYSYVLGFKDIFFQSSV